tara:strand:- start:602 stop:850 length:249 start_codon:yes stop_codon:yes gene_type:complete
VIAEGIIGAWIWTKDLSWIMSDPLAGIISTEFGLAISPPWPLLLRSVQVLSCNLAPNGSSGVALMTRLEKSLCMEQLVCMVG